MPLIRQVEWNNIHGHYHTSDVHTKINDTQVALALGIDPVIFAETKTPTQFATWTWKYHFFGKGWDNSINKAPQYGGSLSYSWYDPSIGQTRTNQAGFAPRNTFWNAPWFIDTTIINVEDQEGYHGKPFVQGGGKNDERLQGLPKGCAVNLDCPEWAYQGERFTESRFRHAENAETFYGINTVYLTTGAVDLAGDIVHSGQAEGVRIISHTGAEGGINYTHNGVDYNVVDYEIDSAGGRENGNLVPTRGKWQASGVENIFNMNHYESKGLNSFYTNLTFYPRYDPYGTYSGIYQAIDDNNTGTNGQYYFEQNLVSKYVFNVVDRPTNTKKQYTFIPQLAKATGYIGGYLWHTIKQLSDTGLHPEDNYLHFHKREGYRDIGVEYNEQVPSTSYDGADPYSIGKDGIGRFFNFTGEEAKVCKEPGFPLETVTQHASGLVYTGQDIENTGGVNYDWSRTDFESGNFRAFLDEITNVSAPEGRLAPSTGIVDKIARLYNRTEPTGLYSGKVNFPICQDPLVARPSAIRLKWKPEHRGTAHAALFVEANNFDNRSWDLDFSGFQLGDGIVGVHSGRSSNDLSPFGYYSDYIHKPYGEAHKRGHDISTERSIAKLGMYNIVLNSALTDGWYPISHFYHHKFGNVSDVEAQEEFEGVYTYAPTLNWYNTSTGSYYTNYDGGYGWWGPRQPYNVADFNIPAPFENLKKYGIYTDGSQDRSSFETSKDAVCYNTYLPMTFGFDSLNGAGIKNEIGGEPFMIKGCGHRFLSGVRTIGVVGDEEQSTELLGYTRNRRTIVSGAYTGAAESAGIRHNLHSPHGSYYIETGEIVHPKLELSLDHGDLYAFNLTGWANFHFPQDTSKPVQFITGFPFTATKRVVVKPNTRKWFCPVDKKSFESIGNSVVQTVDFNDQGDNAMVPEPPVYNYNFDIRQATWAYIDSTPSSPGPYIEAYGERGQIDTTAYFNSSFSFGQLKDNFVEGSYGIVCGDIINRAIYNGKIIDGSSDYGFFGTHDQTHNYETPNAYVKVGDAGYSRLTDWSTGNHVWTSSGQCVGEGKYDPSVVFPYSYHNNTISQIQFSSGAPVSEYSRNIEEYDFGVVPSLITDTKPEGSYTTYPNNSFNGTRVFPDSSTHHNIKLNIEHPNRGMVHFDCSEGYLTGNNDLGLNFIGSGGILDGVDGLGGITGIEWDGDDGATHSFNVYQNWLFIRTWKITPKNRCHSQQDFSIPYFYVWREPLHHTWSEPYAYDDGEGVSIDGGYKVRNVVGDDQYYDVGTPQADANERIQVHSVTQAFCPIVFHENTGTIQNHIRDEIGYPGIDLSSSPRPDPNDNFTNEVFYSPFGQMPFPKRIEEDLLLARDGTFDAEDISIMGNRFNQEFPVIFEFTNYGNFPNYTNSSNNTHSLDGVQGVFKGTVRTFQDLTFDTLMFASPHGDAGIYGHMNPVYSAMGLYGITTWSKLAKEQMTYTPYDGDSNNFVLRLAPGITYEVEEQTLAYGSSAYNRTEDGYWYASAHEDFDQGLVLKTRTGYFQTNGTKYLSSQKELENNLISSGLATPENVNLEIIHRTKTGTLPHYEGYIDYQEALDKNICTFNVKSKNLSPIHDVRSYIQPASGSFNCDAGSNMDQHIFMPCFDTISLDFGSAVEQTYKGTTYRSVPSEQKLTKSVLNAGMFDANMMSLISQQHDLNNVNQDGIEKTLAEELHTFPTHPELKLIQDRVIAGNSTAASGNDYKYYESGYRFGVAESYTTLELGQQEVEFVTGLITSKWHAWGQVNHDNYFYDPNKGTHINIRF